MKPTGDPRALAWLDAQAVETLYLPIITLGELRFAIAALPAGQRRDALGHALDTRILPIFDGRVLPFSQAAAQDLIVATRDVAPFEADGLAVITP